MTLAIDVLKCLLLLLAILPKHVHASGYLLSDEIETTGGHNLGFNNSGVSAVGDVAAIRLNPAMIAMEPAYNVYAGYHWPARGSEFYQAGVVDSKTSSVAAGVMLTRMEGDVGSMQPRLSSTLRTRGALGIAQTLERLSIGLSFQYLEAEDTQSGKTRTGTSLGVGVAGLLHPNLRFGFSGENLNNGRMLPFAPRTVRGGVSLLTTDGTITAHLDYVHREAIDADDWLAMRGLNQPEIQDPWLLAPKSEAEGVPAKPEQLVTLSSSAKVYDLLRLLASYGQSLDSTRRILGGGVALVNGPVTVSYSASRPNLSFPQAHQSVSVSVQMSM